VPPADIDFFIYDGSKSLPFMIFLGVVGKRAEMRHASRVKTGPP